MNRAVCHVVTNAQDGMRIDSILSEIGFYPSRSSAQNAIAKGSVLIDGKIASKSAKVKSGNAIVAELEDESPAITIQGEEIPLDIRYEDEDMIVLSKQAGLVCHPTDDVIDGTLVNALIFKYGKDNLCNVQGEDDRLGIVHRLDADTSGLMLAAKTDEAGQELMDAIRLREVDRRYIALVHGDISVDSGMIDAPIGRNPKDRKLMCVTDKGKVREAITTFRVLKRYSCQGNRYTLVECKLFTGRTHQIRVHMQYIDHPIVGDPIYNSKGPKDLKSNLNLTRQFLHSYKIAFDHPITGKHLAFEDDLANDLQSALDMLESTNDGSNKERS